MGFASTLDGMLVLVLSITWPRRAVQSIVNYSFSKLQSYLQQVTFLMLDGFLQTNSANSWERPKKET
eukprot:5263983-Amphidinium_carterae.1